MKPGNVTHELNDLIQSGKPVVFDGPGTYTTNASPDLTNVRSLVLRGQYANAVDNAVELLLIDSDDEQLLDIRTGIQVRIIGLRLAVHTNRTNAKRIVLQRAAGNAPVLSSINVKYEGSHFAARGSLPLDESIWAYDSVLTSFESCWFTRDVAVRLGRDTGDNPGTFGNGNQAGAAFRDCLFDGDVLQQRGWTFSYTNCAFQRGAKIRPAGMGQDRQVLVQSCAFFGPHNGEPAIEQGALGEDLVVMASRFTRGRHIKAHSCQIIGSGGVPLKP